jgi:hypothetical protein
LIISFFVTAVAVGVNYGLWRKKGKWGILELTLDRPLYK